MEQTTSKLNEEYKGPGKVWSAFGGWGVGALLTSLAVLPFRWSAIKSVFNGEPIKSTGMWLGANLLVLGGSIVGAVVGWNKAERGEQQFRDSQMRANVADNEIAQLKQTVAMQHETHKRFTDTINSRHQAHGDQTHGTHVAAAHAEKEHHAAKEHHTAEAGHTAAAGGHASHENHAAAHAHTQHEGHAASHAQHESHAAAIQAQQAAGATAGLGA